MNTWFRSALLLLLCYTAQSFSVLTPVSHAWFDRNGASLNWETVVNQAAEADIVLFGELHNNAHSHWYEHMLAEELVKRNGANQVFGCEMFEADQQLILNEYLQGLVDSKKIEDFGGTWKNYKNDYKPIIDVAKNSEIPVIATNVPRRYASLVYSRGFEGLESLSPEAKAYLPPLPVLYDSTVKCYADLLQNSFAGHGGSNMSKAQAIKDATMAYHILKNWEKGKKFYHWNGSYHSNRTEGIAWYLKQLNPELKIYVISTVEQEQANTLDKENNGLGQAILVSLETFPHTY